VSKGDWNITPDVEAELLKKHRLVERPTFVDHGAVYHLKTAEDMLVLADKAIASQGMEYLIIHGVERMKPDWGYQDFWPLKQEMFTKLLDGLQEKRDKGKLWITDHISLHQYETQRNTAEVRVIQANDNSIQLEFKCQAETPYYNLPLTFVTQVPLHWKQAKITQREQSTIAVVNKGTIRYDAMPGSIQVEIQEEKIQ
jgi:hypothetical protein